MIIDLHTHIVPARFPGSSVHPSAEDWPSLRPVSADQALVRLGTKDLRTVDACCWDPPRRVAHATSEGVDGQVLSPMSELLSYWFTPQDGLEMARYVNDYICTMVSSSPGRFWGLGMVPLQDPDLAAKELSRVKNDGLHGIEIGSNVLGRSPGDPRFLAFFQEAARLELAIFVHAINPTCVDRLTPADDIYAMTIGYPTDVGLALASLITGGVLDACPTLRFAFSHGGGTFPYFLPRFENQWSGQWNGAAPVPGSLPSPVRQQLPKSPLEYARTLFYDTLLFDKRAIRYLADIVGVSQLTVGTDFPFMPREEPVGRTLRAMDLSVEELEAVTWKNCLRFLGHFDGASA